MCMLSYFPPNVMPDEEELMNGADHNPDGHGWSMVDPIRRQITVHKYMTPDRALDSFVAARKACPGGPALFHSRIGTSGRIDITGVHPFFVGNDRHTVVGHNGILFSPDGPKSDTAVFAQSIMPLRFAALDRRKTIRKLEKYCGPGNKLVVLSVNPIRAQSAYIINERQGHWSGESGAWHSNYDYRGWFTSYGKDIKSYSYLWDGDNEDAPWDKRPESGMSPWPCEVCNSCNAVDMGTNFCGVCGCCNDCLVHQTECQCWVPAAREHLGEIALEEPRQRKAYAAIEM